MTRIFFLCSLFAVLVSGPVKSFAGNPGAKQTGSHNKEMATKMPAGHSSPVHAEKGHLKAPSWDELAHIHHFHKERLKKMKRHYRKSVLMSKLLLVLVHAAILFVSYLHVVH